MLEKLKAFNIFEKLFFKNKFVTDFKMQLLHCQNYKITSLSNIDIIYIKCVLQTGEHTD